MNSSIHRYSVFNSQRGAALVVGLILLLIMTVVAVAGMQGSIFEERMASNYRDHDRAFQSAETALKEGERFVLNVVHPLQRATPNGDFGLFRNDSAAAIDFRDPALSLSDVAGTGTQVAHTDTADSGGGPLGAIDFVTAATPEYIVELLQCRDNAVGESLDMFGAFPGAESPPVCSNGENPTNAYYRISARGIGADPTSEVLIESVMLRRF